MNYRSVFLAATILIGGKSSTSCLIARHLDCHVIVKSHLMANKELENKLKCYILYILCSLACYFLLVYLLVECRGSTVEGDVRGREPKNHTKYYIKDPRLCR
jgi:hypothetical protein